jgi:hypothetical protein
LRQVKRRKADLTVENDGMRSGIDDRTDLERALLRRGVVQRTADTERCERCRRTPLIGERVYVLDRGGVCCELCRAVETRAPVDSRVVRGPAHGHSIRLTDRRAA